MKVSKLNEFYRRFNNATCDFCEKEPPVDVPMFEILQENGYGGYAVDIELCDSCVVELQNKLIMALKGESK